MMKRLLHLTVLLLFCSPAWAAWGSVATLGSNNDKTANTASIVLTTTAAAEAGNVVAVHIAVDNNDGVQGDNGRCSIADSAGGNTWTKALEFTNTNGGAAQDGSVSCWFISKLTNQINSGGTITVSFSGTAANYDAKAISAWEFSIGAGNVLTVQAGAQTVGNDAADPTSQTISGLTSGEYLFLHGIASEGPTADTYTYSTSYTVMTENGTTGGAAGSNMETVAEFRIFTGTGDTVDVASNTADRDYAQTFVAISEAAPAPRSRVVQVQ